MAQLRDTKTSECVFEGSTFEIALMAKKLGEGQVIFDGVGETFSPQAVLDAADSYIEGMRGVAKSRAKDTTSDMKEAAKAHIASHEDEVANVEASIAAAEAAIQKARDRLKG